MPKTFSFGCLVAEVVVGGNLAVRQKLGNLLWPEIASRYIEQSLRQHLPQSSSEFLEFERQAVMAREMERCLIERGYALL